MMHTIHVRYVSYEYGIKYAYGIEYMHGKFSLSTNASINVAIQTNMQCWVNVARQRIVG